MRLILASASPYKAALFARLHIPFETMDARIDETPRPGEAAEALARRLSETKARAAFRGAEGEIVIGADQAAASAPVPIVGKPGSAEANRAQLLTLSGQRVVFYTAATVLTTHREPQTVVDRTEVQFRPLTEAEVDAYLAIEPSHDCAGGCKVEGLGITLLERVTSTDPTALIGLPLIQLCKVLADYGVPLPISSSNC